MQKMLMTFETKESICHVLTEGDKHPIYYSLQRAFNTITSDQKEDAQSTHTYARISYFFNTQYSINVMPYNPSRDDEYLYLRELESKSVDLLWQISKNCE